MPEWTLTIIVAVISAAAGAIPGIAALHRARTEKVGQQAAIEAKASETAIALWESLNLAQSQRIQVLTERLAKSEEVIRKERETNRELGERLDVLESEIRKLKRELMKRDARIAELEACR